MNTLYDKLEQNKKWLMLSLIYTFVWGLVAHGYLFFQNSFSHDSLSEFNGSFFGNGYKIELGRFVVPLYRMIFRTNLTLPWLIGILSLIWIGISVFLVTKIFKIESRGILFLISGLFSVNICVSATAATYLHDLDCNMFALLSAVIAVWLWKMVKFGWIAGAVFVMAIFGIYPSFVSVTIALIVFSCIFSILDEIPYQEVFIKGLKGIGMLLIGGVLYYLIMQLSLYVTGRVLDSGSYNSLDNALKLQIRDIPQLIWKASHECYIRLQNVPSSYPAWLIRLIVRAAIVIVGIEFVVGLFIIKTNVIGKLLCMLLAAVIPLSMNITYVLTSGMIHDLMTYAIWLFYLFVLLIANWMVKKLSNCDKKACFIAKTTQFTCIFLIGVFLYGSVPISNMFYLQKKIEHDAFLSYMNRVVYTMENFEGYDAETTRVVFVGEPEQMKSQINGFEQSADVVGFYGSSPLTDNWINRARAYFEYVMLYPIVLAEEDIWNSMQNDTRVSDMQSYPKDGSIAFLDDILVVKLG